MGVANTTTWQRKYPANDGLTRTYGLANVQAYLFNDGCNTVFGDVIKDAYIAQIWARLHGDQIQSVQDTQLVVSPGNSYVYNKLVQWAQFEVTEPLPASADYVYGRPDINMLGYYAWHIGDFLLDLKWINFKKQWFEAPSPNCNGISIFLKPGLSGTLRVGQPPGHSNDVFHGPALGLVNPALGIFPF